MKGNTIKILVAGARYTGKGQIGREWGETDADLPTLQPVILYDRNIVHEDKPYRVVAWILSYDPEFEDLRAAFFPGADGIIFTYNICENPAISIPQLDIYIQELKRVLKRLPPSVLVGVRLNADKDISEGARISGLNWAKAQNMPKIEANYLYKQQFASAVDEAFSYIITMIFNVKVLENGFKQFS